MSCLREYHPTGCCPIVINTPVCDLASGSPYEASAKASNCRFEGRLIITPSDLVDSKYVKTLVAA